MFAPIASSPDPTYGLMAKLRAVREMLDRIEQVVSREEVFTPAPRNSGSGAADHSIDLGLFAEQLYKERGLRARFVDDDLLGEPAWDMLLDLYVAHQRGREITVSSSCIASRVPSSTALRWLGKLEESQLVARRRPPGDARRCVVELTPRAVDRMTELLLRLAGYPAR